MPPKAYRGNYDTDLYDKFPLIKLVSCIVCSLGTGVAKLNALLRISLCAFDCVDRAKGGQAWLWESGP